MKDTVTGRSNPAFPKKGDGVSSEAALRTSQAQLQTLFDAAPLGIYLVDADFKICQVNPAALPVFGNIPDLIGSDFNEVIHQLWSKEYADEIVKIFRNTLETGEPYFTPQRTEERLDRGVTEIYEWQIHRIPLPDGRFGVVCYFRDISAQVLARQAVVESEKRMRLITDSMPGLIAYVDAGQHYNFVNRAYEHWFGYKQEDIVGKYLWEVLGEAAYRILLPHVERVLAGEDFTFEQWIPYRTGGRRFVRVHYLPDTGADGQVNGYFASVIDITERRRHEMKMNCLIELGDIIRRAERTDELLSAVCELTAGHFEVSHCVFSQIDQELNLAVNITEYRAGQVPSLLGSFRLSDYPNELVKELSKGRAIEVSDAKTNPKTAVPFETAFAPVGARAFVSLPILRNEDWVGALLINHTEPRQWTEDQVNFLGIIAERTWTAVEKLRGEAALRESEARFRTLANSAPVMIWVNGVDGGCEFVNNVYLEFFGKTLEEVQGFGWQPSLHPDDEEPYVQSYLAAFNARAPFRCQARLKNRNGEYRWVESFGMPRFSDSGEFLGYIGISPDITEIKWAEQALKEKNKELEQFAYIASHDLQEPVNTITGYISLMENELQLDENQSQYFQFIKDSCQRMKLLTSDLLQHSRIGSSSQPQQLDLKQLVKEVLHDMDGSVKTKTADIQVGELPVMTVYPTEMRLLFQNLLSNALKFQKPGGTPRISVTAAPEKTDGGWHFVVEDNGIGIEPKYYERIFTIFQRLHSAQEFDGTGIGLAHCRKIVDLHRGKIWVESEAGMGSRFHFIIRELG